MKLLAYSILAIGLSIAIATAEDGTFTLPYQKENRWVASKDGADLRALIKTARKQKKTHFLVQLPEEKRDVSVERLIVLRDILEKNLKSGVIIEEIDGTTPQNKISVRIK